jgi:hypothetical protein
LQRKDCTSRIRPGTGLMRPITYPPTRLAELKVGQQESVTRSPCLNGSPGPTLSNARRTDSDLIQRTSTRTHHRTHSRQSITLATARHASIARCAQGTSCAREHLFKRRTMPCTMRTTWRSNAIPTCRYAHYPAMQRTERPVFKGYWLRSGDGIKPSRQRKSSICTAGGPYQSPFAASERQALLMAGIAIATSSAFARL